MGWLVRGDEALHYSDNSHRWTAPMGVDQQVWEAGLRAHMAMHRAGAPEQPQPSPRDKTIPPTTGPQPRPTS